MIIDWKALKRWHYSNTRQSYLYLTFTHTWVTLIFPVLLVCYCTKLIFDMTWEWFTYIPESYREVWGYKKYRQHK